MSSASCESLSQKYEIVDTIGKGSFGTVRRVRRRADGRLLVAKSLHYGAMSDKEKQLLVGEVNILKRLRHANIVKYYDRIVDWRATTLHIVMEYCAAGDLASLIRTCRREHTALAEDVIWNIVAQLVSGEPHCVPFCAQRRSTQNPPITA